MSLTRPALGVIALAATLVVPGCARKAPALAIPVQVFEPAEKAPPPTFERVPDEENPFLHLPPAEDLTGAGPYRLAVDDILDISVYGEVDLQHVEVPVRPDGRISFAFIGDIRAAGRTVEEVREEMMNRLGRYLRSPQVAVIAKEFAQKKVFVGGEVKTPGVFYLTGREGTLLDVLYKAGLTTEKAGLDSAYLMRDNKVVAADFTDLVLGDLSRNIELANQDVVFVPENKRRFIYVLGEVRRNDAFDYNRPAPILDVLARAGGFGRFAKRKEIVVIRGSLKEPQVAYVNARALLEGDLSQNIMIQPGDIVYVSLSKLGKYNQFIDGILRTVAIIFQGTQIAEEFESTP